MAGALSLGSARSKAIAARGGVMLRMHRAVIIGAMVAVLPMTSAVAGAMGNPPQPQGHAQVSPQADASSKEGLEQWLQTVSAAARSLNYSGVFITQRGEEISTSSLIHYVLPQGHFERIETLDGQRRIMVSFNDQVRTSWPDYRLTLIDNQVGQASFPRLLKTTNGEVDRNYRLERGGLERCAGYECRMSTLLPRDDLRWGYRLWSLPDSRLLVKAQTLDAEGHVIDQVAFTELKINVHPRQDLVRESLHQPPGYTVEKMKVVPVSLSSQGWALSSQVPGFKTVGVFRRSMSVGGKSSEVLQWLLSDGLASVSIFVQPAADLTEPVPSEQRIGGTLALSRRIGESWLTVMGAVPERTLRRISEAVVRVQ
ncbi:sigma E regulatory protein, MucB/RseB [Thiomonas bhubaneswarensis]|uniref:Sigma E regulatory protein, MucB/RseB n=2 Tax=Thiomonas bhubaneswarensis TaxID=339866 RepID=A0A0K6I3T9_9BURK|nr:sigma E regulatory protein, MucB/RseB [Thiomonas bhubaneswarensis]